MKFPDLRNILRRLIGVYNVLHFIFFYIFRATVMIIID